MTENVGSVISITRWSQANLRFYETRLKRSFDFFKVIDERLGILPCLSAYTERLREHGKNIYNIAKPLGAIESTLEESAKAMGAMAEDAFYKMEEKASPGCNPHQTGHQLPVSHRHGTFYVSRPALCLIKVKK